MTEQTAIDRYVRLKEDEERLVRDKRFNAAALTSIKPEVAAEIAAAGGMVRVEMHGDQYDLHAEITLTPVSGSAAMKKRLYEMQNGRCNAPRCSTPMQMRQLEIDHIIPVSKGGHDVEDNCQLLCPWCNKTKGDRDMVYLDQRLAEQEEVGLDAR